MTMTGGRRSTGVESSMFSVCLSVVARVDALKYQPTPRTKACMFGFFLAYDHAVSVQTHAIRVNACHTDAEIYAHCHILSLFSVDLAPAPPVPF